MGNYLFRMPKDTPALRFGALARYAGETYGVPVKIGSTVEVTRYRGHVRGPKDDHFQFSLYGLTLAYIFADRVEFGDWFDEHMATTEWLRQIVTDNGIGTNVGRELRKRHHVINLAGQGFAPLEGRSFKVDLQTVAERIGHLWDFYAEHAPERAVGLGQAHADIMREIEHLRV